MECGDGCVAHEIARVQVQLVVVEIWRGRADALSELWSCGVDRALRTELVDHPVPVAVHDPAIDFVLLVPCHVQLANAACPSRPQGLALA